MSKTNPARGMRDFLPTDVRKREYVIGVIKSVYESYGFQPLETPAVENIDTLMGKYGDEGNQLIFKVLKRGEKLGESLESIIQAASLESRIYDATLEGKLLPRLVNPVADLALRYDLTVPLARVVANNRDKLPKFFKRYQIQPVWRADRPARGRFREFYQCDVDCIGSGSMVVEAEIISAVSKILTQLGFRFVVQINHRTLLTCLLDSAQIPQDLHGEAFVAIDKFDKISDVEMVMHFSKLGVAEKFTKIAPWFGKVRHRRQEAREIASEQFEKSKSLTAFGLEFNRFLLNAVGELTKDLSNAQEAISEIEQVIQLASDAPVFFNPFLARGLSYYTGPIMEIILADGDFSGSIGGGGRYDGLIGMFGKEQIPACGFSLGLERILVVMEERGMFPPEIADSTPANVMVTIWSDETIAESLKLANEFRAQNLRVTVYPEADKLGKQMKYADSIKVPYVCVLGESELADGTVTLKNMQTGEQQAYPRGEIASKIV